MLIPNVPTPIHPHALSLPAVISSSKRPEIEDASLRQSPSKKRKLLNSAKVPTMSTLDVLSITPSPVFQNPSGISSTLQCPTSPVASQINKISLRQGKPKRQSSREPLQVIENLRNLRMGSNKRVPKPSIWLKE